MSRSRNLAIPVQFYDGRSPVERLGHHLGWLMWGLLAEPWLLMLILGALHSRHPEVPALGFVTVWLVDMAVGLLISRYPWYQQYEVQR